MGKIKRSIKIPGIFKPGSKANKGEVVPALSSAMLARQKRILKNKRHLKRYHGRNHALRRNKEFRI